MSSINSQSLLTDSSQKEESTSKKKKKKINQLEEEVNYSQEASLSRKVEFEKGLPLSYGFADNTIFTIPFSFRGYLSFIGKKISESPLNICIMVVCFYYLIAFLVDIQNFGHLDIFFLSHFIYLL